MPLCEGDLIEIDGNDQVGHEQRGRRPALILSVDELQSALGLAIACAVTTHGGKATRARNELEVPIPPGLRVEGVILPHQLRTIDLSARKAEKLCTVPRTTLQAVRVRVRTLLGM